MSLKRQALRQCVDAELTGKIIECFLTVYNKLDVATDLLPPIAKRQLLNYLRVSRLDVGLLLHFGPKPTFHRLESPRIRE